MSDKPENKPQEPQGEGRDSRGGGNRGYAGARKPQGSYAKGGSHGEGGRRGGDRKPYDKSGAGKKPYRKEGDRKPYDRDRKPYDGERKPYDKDRAFGGERKHDGERKFDRDRKFDKDRKFEGDRKPYGKGRKFDDDRRPYDRHRKFDGDRDRKPYDKDQKFDGDRERKFDRDRKFEGDRNRKPYDRERKFDGERKPYDKDRKPRFEADAAHEGKAFRAYEGDRKSFGRDHDNGNGNGRNRDREERARRFGSSPKDQARMGYQGRKSFDPSNAVSPARVAALKVVSQLRKRDAFAQDLIDKHIDDTPMKSEDRAFATKLALGVASTYGTLDDILNRCMNDPSDVRDDVRDALRISAYEIVFLDKGAHAAVDQGVELVRSVAPRASGVANAILRKVVTAKDEFPFGNPQREMGAFARQHAFPQWLAEEFVAAMGPDGAHEFMEVCNEPAPVFIALNAAKEGEDVLGTLAAAKDEPRQAAIDGFEIPGCYQLNSGQVLADGRLRRLLNNGHLLVSDAASQAVAHLVLPDEKPASMLEIGAGRATKTILIQSNAQRKWASQIEEYVTLDNHAFKTKLLTQRAQQYGVRVSEALTGDATNLEPVLGERTFDVVFVDAPCTGLGTLRRHPEIRWRLKPETVDEYAQLGLNLLKEASKHVSAGGTLAFATCTITSKENAGVIKAFLESPEGAAFQLVPLNGKSAFASPLTAGGCDAHFAAKMVRRPE